LSGTLVLRLEAPDSDHCAWQLADGSDAASFGRGSLAEAADAAPGRRVVLLVAGTDVLVTRVQVPARSRSKALAAIPWALEDRLIDDVETLHFAVGPADDQGFWPVAVIARERFDTYLAAVRGAGIEPHSVTAEQLALPQPDDDVWTVLEEAGRVTVRTGVYTGFACEPELLSGVARAHPQPSRLQRLASHDAPPTDWSEAWAQPPEAADAADTIEHPVAAFDAANTGIELRQGPYSRRQRMGRVARQWRLPAALAVASLVLIAADTAADYVGLGQREAQLRGRMEQIFRETFPDVQRVVNPRAQMSTRLESLRSGGDESRFADLLARTGQVVGGTEGATIERLRWRRDRLEIELQASDLQVLDQLRERIAATGLSANLDRAERQGDRVAGRIIIEEGTS